MAIYQGDIGIHDMKLGNIHFYTGHEWGKMENYDICLNTSVLSEEECVELLMKLAG